MVMQIDLARRLGDIAALNSGDQTRLPSKAKISSGIFGQASPPSAASASGAQGAPVVDKEEEEADRAVLVFIEESYKPVDQQRNLEELQNKAIKATDKYVETQRHRKPFNKEKLKKAARLASMAAASAQGLSETGEYFVSKKFTELLTTKLAVANRVKIKQPLTKQEGDDIARLVAESRRVAHLNVAQWANAVEEYSRSSPDLVDDCKNGQARAEQMERRVNLVGDQVEKLIRQSGLNSKPDDQKVTSGSNVPRP